jgi:serine protease Do
MPDCRPAILALLCAIAVSPLAQADPGPSDDMRLTPMVRAVRDASPSVVNIQGQKTVTEAADGSGRVDAPRQVNGMGTGVVIDPRGYILTNHHVVDGVRQINVTLDDQTTYVARLVARDPATDLAVIKINCARELPVIRIGTSSDLMPAETVIAVGNAYGYRHTVTHGIVSALHRDVQVSDTQSYDDLIQTDASINPGNSGGPLLNIHGEMIGVNVAVRAGAQGIGFAIPVDKALDIAARMMSIDSIEGHWHGLVTRTLPRSKEVLVERVMPGSPADDAGVRPGDTLTQAGSVKIERALDIERALLGQSPATDIPVDVIRGGEAKTLAMHIARRPGHAVRKSFEAAVVEPSDRTWDLLGLSLVDEPSSTFARSGTKYTGGVRVKQVRPGSSAAAEGIREGDILVGVHRWQTSSMQDVEYIVSRTNVSQMGPVKFYILRGNDTFYGQVKVASQSTASRR